MFCSGINESQVHRALPGYNKKWIPFLCVEVIDGLINIQESEDKAHGILWTQRCNSILTLGKIVLQVAPGHIGAGDFLLVRGITFNGSPHLSS